jgi:glycosyltransferase involved in cell wall biosynthesis
MMPKLIYLTLVRIPTEKAHGLQIVQNCEAFAEVGYTVELWTAWRRNTPALRQVRDFYAHYGITHNFERRTLPALDLYPLLGGNPRLERFAYYVHAFTALLWIVLRVLFTRAEVYYTRDEWVAYALSWVKPARQIVYEAHLFAPQARGAWLQSQVVQRSGSTIAITPDLRQALIEQRGAPPERVLVAHDGIRAARFANLPTREAARTQLGWSPRAYIVGFVGQLHMLNVDKGVGTLLQAVAQVDEAHLALVGGPAEQAERLRQQWVALGLPAARFLYAGQVPPHAVPLYLRAFDVCAMPHPRTEQFAHYTSPLKLFEYLAAGRAVVASDLPAWADVVTHGKTAYLVPAGDVAALTTALQHLQDDPILREHLAQAGQLRAQDYTWYARAQAIKAHITRADLA